MKVVCEGIDLSDAVLKVVKACSSKTTVPVLECIKLSAKNDSLTLAATDGEISIQKTIKADVMEEGEICVPGRYFSDFIKKLEGVQITLSANGRKMDIFYVDSQTDMQVLPADDFPKSLFLQLSFLNMPQCNADLFLQKGIGTHLLVSIHAAVHPKMQLVQYVLGQCWKL